MTTHITQLASVYQAAPSTGSLQWCKVPSEMNITSVNDETSIGGAFDELVPTLLECFAVVFIGYLAGRFRLISGPEIKGLSVFTSEFALPPLIFLNLVTINLGNVNWSFIAGILLGKVAVFLLVATTTVAIHRPINLAFAGLYAIFCTQGNDFGLAYPIVSSLYGHRHPMYAGYLYLIAPISLMILNPIGFLMMEIERVRSGSIQVADHRSSKWLVAKMILSVLWEILKNPNVFMTILGIIGNFVFAGELPALIYGILRVLSSAFAATVLFLLGFRVVGAAASLAGSGLLLPGVLLAVRMLATPLILCAAVKLLCTKASDQDDLVNYAFLYGTVPTGPVVLLFAAQYGLPTDMLASTMVVCTFLSGPLMFVSAKMITLNFTGVLSYAGHLKDTLFYISIIGVLGCAWVAILFLLSGRWKRPPHLVTFCLVISQAVNSAGVLMWSAVNNNTISSIVFQVAMITGGQLASRLWTAVLAISLVLLQRYTVTYLFKLIPYSLGFGFGVPIVILTALLVTTGLQNHFPRVNQNLPLFLYGKSEAVAASCTLAICLLTTTLCLILYHRKSKSNYCAPGTFGINNEGVASNFHWLEEGKLHGEPAKEVGSRNKQEKDEGTNEMVNNAMNPELKNLEHEVPIIDNFDEEVQPSESMVSEKASISIILEDLENTGSNRTGPTWMRAETSFHKRNPTYFIPGVGGRRKIPSSGKKSRWRIFLSTIQRSTTTTSMRDLLSDAESNGIDSPSSSFPPSETSSTAEITEKTNKDQQSLRHVILLTLLSISMTVGLTVSVWKLIAETPSGLFVAMEFLDGVLNFGQGIFAFAVFGFDTKAVVLPVIKWIRILRKGTQGPVLPLEDQLDDDTAFTCFQFLTYHYENCLQDLPRDKCFKSKTYKSVFWGKELVDWLITVGLARGRKDAELYGRRLLNGRVIKHVNEQMHFKDGIYLYAFIPQVEY
ncbi:integral membrane protein GPR155-like isoform X2 [Limulus polyphemus]|uniref:Integral membrane protein GPR155-like isoform X2 n=1 Tax=Limulus polyphemus TaxID=6850 RepID=A0ABM1TCZ8_LIMPO|nr:integral membrane protein GPR155-like isoform X2 [Limulus polyphemus]